LIGDKAVDVEVQSASRWLINNVVATQYSKGRVSRAGDAVHRYP